MGSVVKYAAGAFGSSVSSFGRVPQLHVTVDFAVCEVYGYLSREIRERQDCPRLIMTTGS